MAKSITQRELRNSSGEIMRELDRGQSFVVTWNGVPVAELTPIRRGHFVKTANVLAAVAGTEPVDYRVLRADLDAAADHDPWPRA